MNPEACIQLLTTLLQSRKNKLSQKLKTVDINSLEQPTAAFKQQLNARFSTLSQLSNWANARDVETLAQAVFRVAVKSITNDFLALIESMVLQEMDCMITEHMERQMVTRSNENKDSRQFGLPVSAQSAYSHAPSTSSSTKVEPPQNISDNFTEPPCAPRASTEATESRDPGVTDEIWSQLQEDKAREEAWEHDYQRLLEKERNAREAVKEAREKEEPHANQAPKEREEEDDEERWRREQERLRRELGRRAIEDDLDKLQKQRQKEQEHRKHEQKAQQKLRDMGVCPVGYRWIKQASGYLCAGGSHYVSNEQLWM